MKKIYPLMLLLTFATCASAQIQLDLIEFAQGPASNGFNRPCELVHAGDERLFVVEQPGRIMIINPDGSHETTPFLDISSQVQSGGNEQGLLGLAFDPEFETNNRFYVNYTTTISGTTYTHISRFMVSDENPNVADPASEVVLLEIVQDFANHNGGHIEFAADGMLYIGMGDGGSFGDPNNRAQDLSSLLGKMLRIDVSGETYTIPEDNPYFGVEGIPGEIWNYGLRNPWKFTFDSENGDLWIADVGQTQWEEINYIEGGDASELNFGWRCREGLHSYNSSGCETEGFTDPIFEYSHSDGCSVTGGKVYRGNEYEELYGKYIFADYCSGNFWMLNYNDAWELQVHQQDNLGGSIVAFGEDINNNLYAVDASDGFIYRLSSSISSVDDHEFINSLSLFPNPAKDVINLEFNLVKNTAYIIKLTDVSGKEVYNTGAQGTLGENHFQIDMEALTGGVYFVTISMENQTDVVRKIVRQ